MPEDERSIPEKGLEPEHSFGEDESEDVSARLGPPRGTGRGWESALDQKLSLKFNISPKPDDLTNADCSS